MTCVDHGLLGNKPGGYHQVRVDGRLQYVHRIAYANHHSLSLTEVPALLRHTCDNPRCINPHHLILGSHQDNANDRVSRGRSAKELVAKRVLSEEKATHVVERYLNRANHYCKVNGVTALAKEFNVSTQAIYGAIKRATHNRT